MITVIGMGRGLSRGFVGQKALDKFKAFLAQNDMIYGYDEIRTRYNIYEAATEAVDQHNAEYAQGLQTYLKTVNMFSVMYESEKAAYRNLDPSKVSGRSLVSSSGPATDAQMIAALNEFGSLSVVLYASDNFMSYGTGVYLDPSCPTSSVNHAANIVGHGNDPVQGDYWIVRNQWGAGWGDKGYILMARNVNQCNINISPAFPVDMKCGNMESATAPPSVTTVPSEQQPSMPATAPPQPTLPPQNSPTMAAGSWPTTFSTLPTAHDIVVVDPWPIMQTFPNTASTSTYPGATGPHIMTHIDTGPGSWPTYSGTGATPPPLPMTGPTNPSTAPPETTPTTATTAPPAISDPTISTPTYPWWWWWPWWGCYREKYPGAEPYPPTWAKNLRQIWTAGPPPVTAPANPSTAPLDSMTTIPTTAPPSDSTGSTPTYMTTTPPYYTGPPDWPYFPCDWPWPYYPVPIPMPAPEPMPTNPSTAPPGTTVPTTAPPSDSTGSSVPTYPGTGSTPPPLPMTMPTNPTTAPPGTTVPTTAPPGDSTGSTFYLSTYPAISTTPSPVIPSQPTSGCRGKKKSNGKGRKRASGNKQKRGAELTNH